MIVQGLGNVGYHAAKFLSEEDGALITGIIERDGALIERRGWMSRRCTAGFANMAGSRVIPTRHMSRMAHSA